MRTVFAITVGAGVGAAFGLLLARARGCSRVACNVKVNLVISVISGAFFGAAVAWWFLTRP